MESYWGGVAGEARSVRLGNRVRRRYAMAWIQPLRVGEIKVAHQTLPRSADAVVGLEIHLLALHATPQPFDELVVALASLGVLDRAVDIDGPLVE